MSFSLYEIAAQYKDVLANAFDLDELSDENVEQLSKLEDDIENKAVNIAAFIRNLETEADTVRAAAKEMLERAKKLEGRIENLSNYLKYTLESCGIKEIRKSPHFVIKVKQNPASVVIDNESIINPLYLKVKEVVSIDKKAIKDDIENGIEVPGAHLQKQTRIEIK